MTFDASSADPQQLYRQLEQIHEEVHRFVTGTVHDLRAQQRGIATSAQLLQELLGESVPQEVRDVLARLLEGTAKVNVILAAAQSYASALPGASYSFHEIDVMGVVRDALASLEPEIRNSGATVAFGELPEVWGDRDRLKELFQRLIDNALKYRAESPAKIEIGAQAGTGPGNPDEILFSVRDHGIGIDQKYQRDLFRPFRRLHGSEIPGLGLGLVICRRIVETHGGKLWIESARGSGTTVFFTLPVPPELGPQRA